MNLLMEEEEGQKKLWTSDILAQGLYDLTFLYNFALVKEFVHLLSQVRTEVEQALFKLYLLFILQTRKINKSGVNKGLIAELIT